MRTFIQSLMSRKLLVTCLGVFLLYQNHQYTEMVAVILGYVGVQGASDLVKSYKSGTLTSQVIENAMSHNTDYEVDTTKIETGNASPIPMFDQEPPKE